MAGRSEFGFSSAKPPRLEDAGLEETALSSAEIEEAFAKAAGLVHSATPAGEGLIADPPEEEEEGGTAADTEPGCTESTGDLGERGGTLPCPEPEGQAEEGSGIGGDKGCSEEGAAGRGSETGGCGADKGSVIGSIGEGICDGVKGILDGLGGLEGVVDKEKRLGGTIGLGMQGA